MIKYLVNEKDRTVTAKFINNKTMDTGRTTWLKYIVNGVYKSVAENKECSNVSLTDKVVYQRVKDILKSKELSSKSYYGIAKCSKFDKFDITKGKYLAKKRLLRKYYNLLHGVLLILIYDMSIPTHIPFKVCEDSVEKANDIASEIRLFIRYGIMLNLDEEITETQGKELYIEETMDNNNYVQKQNKDKDKLALGNINIDNIKIEVEDSVVRTSMFDGRNEYVYRVKSKDNSSKSLQNAIIESIDYVKQFMEERWPRYNDLYYTVDFSSNELVCVENWRACTYDIILKKNGLIFETKEEAVAVAKKMLEVVQEGKD